MAAKLHKKDVEEKKANKTISEIRICRAADEERLAQGSSPRNASSEDLHDYMDVHRNLTDLLRRARASIIAGDYQPRVPEVVLEEKGLGITRKLSVLNPVDAIVLQTATEVLHPRVEAHQPSGNAYYSRSHSLPKVEDLEGSFGYPWWVL